MILIKYFFYRVYTYAARNENPIKFTSLYRTIAILSTFLILVFNVFSVCFLIKIEISSFIWIIIGIIYIPLEIYFNFMNGDQKVYECFKSESSKSAYTKGTIVLSYIFISIIIFFVISSSSFYDNSRPNGAINIPLHDTFKKIQIKPDMLKEIEIK